jgi:hypothetical protein
MFKIDLSMKAKVSLALVLYFVIAKTNNNTQLRKWLSSVFGFLTAEISHELLTH